MLMKNIVFHKHAKPHWITIENKAEIWIWNSHPSKTSSQAAPWIRPLVRQHIWFDARVCPFQCPLPTESYTITLSNIQKTSLKCSWGLVPPCHSNNLWYLVNLYNLNTIKAKQLLTKNWIFNWYFLSQATVLLLNYPMRAIELFLTYTRASDKDA